MAKISGERLKEMEAEMNRFEEEILSTKQVEENDELKDFNEINFQNCPKDADERHFQNHHMAPPGPSMPPPGIRLGPRLETTGPRLVIHTNAFNHPQSQMTHNKDYIMHNFEMRPPPPPPLTLTNPEPRFQNSQPQLEQNMRPPYFIPPQLRFRPNYSGPQRPFYPMMSPPRPYMMGPGQGPMMAPGSGPNGSGPINRPNYNPRQQINASENGHDNSFAEKYNVDRPIAGPQIIYSAPPMKRKIEPVEVLETKLKNDNSKKSKLDKIGKKKGKKAKDKGVNLLQTKEQNTRPKTDPISTNPKKEETDTQSIPLPPIELKPPPSSKPLLFKSVPNPFATPPTLISKPEGENEVTPIVLGPPKSTITGTKKEKKEKKNKYVRMAASAVWEDPSLGDWDQDDFRMFCGDLGNEVGDDTLARAFNKYPSFQKARVIRDKRTNKTKGFGFVSFKDPNDFVRAMREMNGRYVGNRPIKLRKSVWQERQIDNVKKKEREKKKLGFK